MIVTISRKNLKVFFFSKLGKSDVFASNNSLLDTLVFVFKYRIACPKFLKFELEIVKSLPPVFS